jgi:hypothetical protein
MTLLGAGMMVLAAGTTNYDTVHFCKITMTGCFWAIFLVAPSFFTLDLLVQRKGKTNE